MPLPPIPDWAQSSTTLCGGVSTELTIPALIDCINSGSDEDRRLLADAIWDNLGDSFTYANPTMLSLFNVEENAQVAPILIEAASYILESLNIHGSVAFRSSGPCGFAVIYTPPGDIDIQLELTPDCLGGSGSMNVADALITYDKCGVNNNVQDTVAMPVLVDDQGNSQQGFFQLLMNKLSSLERCCNPCNETLQGQDTRHVTGFQTIDFTEVYPEGYIYKVLFSAIEFTDQRVLQYLKPGIGYFGNFAWVYNHELIGPIQWINFQDQVAFAPQLDQKVTGIVVHLFAGVEAGLELYGKPSWAAPAQL